MLLSLFALTQHGSLSSAAAGSLGCSATHNLSSSLTAWCKYDTGVGPSEHVEGLVQLGAQQGKVPEKQSLFKAVASVLLCLGGFRG